MSESSKAVWVVAAIEGVEDDCEFCFVEQWATQEHLNAHIRSDLYGAIHGAFKILTDQSEIELTTAEDTTLSGGLPSGKP